MAGKSSHTIKRLLAKAQQAMLKVGEMHALAAHDLPKILDRNNRVGALSREFAQSKQRLQTCRPNALLLRKAWQADYTLEECVLESVEITNDYGLRLAALEVAMRDANTKVRVALDALRTKRVLPPSPSSYRRPSEPLQAVGRVVTLVTNPFSNMPPPAERDA